MEEISEAAGIEGPGSRISLFDSAVSLLKVSGLIGGIECPVLLTCPKESALAYFCCWHKVNRHLLCFLL